MGVSGPNRTVKLFLSLGKNAEKGEGIKKLIRPLQLLHHIVSAAWAQFLTKNVNNVTISGLGIIHSPND